LKTVTQHISSLPKDEPALLSHSLMLSSLCNMVGLPPYNYWKNINFAFGFILCRIDINGLTRVEGRAVADIDSLCSPR
jgi:hypothetical protein